MTTPLTVQTRREEDTVVLEAVGEIDASNVSRFAEALDTATSQATDKLVVDLSAVEYLNSAAINVLVPHAESLHIVANPLLLRAFQVSGLAALARIDEAARDGNH